MRRDPEEPRALAVAAQTEQQCNTRSHMLVQGAGKEKDLLLAGAKVAACQTCSLGCWLEVSQNLVRQRSSREEFTRWPPFTTV